ncbi:MAG TPA: anthrone oxygenase family protein [Pyrinomonadaceae bacterium]|nr:anthrone oxygenase family protein [Pyrinomonadaceae bacterium]
MNQIVFYLTLITALGSGLIAGTFFVFSVAIMEALRRLPANTGMAAMQSINVVIQNPLFLGVFAGTALLSLILAVLSLIGWNTAGSAYLLAGVVIYFVGSFVVTMALNVPLNNALDAADPTSFAGEGVWNNYLRNWTFWNHVRTVASLASMTLLILALIDRSK